MKNIDALKKQLDSKQNDKTYVNEYSFLIDFYKKHNK
jgi:hypothetical protein